MTPSGTTHSTGLRRPGDPRVWGAGIGAIGATVFVLANRDLLGTPWAPLALAAYAVALALFVWAVLLLVRDFGPLPQPRTNPLVVYLAAVAFELGLIYVGSQLLERIGLIELRPALIVLAVGLHFIPFAWVFRLPLFMPLAIVMSVLGVVGLILGATVNTVFAPAIAVVTGVAMLLIIAHDAWSARAARAAAPAQAFANSGEGISG